jgi:hypothetical protein
MSDELKVTDTETREWMDKLSVEDKAELKRQALLKRAIEMSQPDKPVDWGSLSSEQFEQEKRKLFKNG